MKQPAGGTDRSAGLCRSRGRGSGGVPPDVDPIDRIPRGASCSTESTDHEFRSLSAKLRGVIGDCRRDEFRWLVSRRRGPAPGPPTPRTVQSGRPACTSRGLLHRSRVRPRGVIGDCRRDEFRLLGSRRRGPAPGPPTPRTVQSGRPACTSRGLLHRSRVRPRGVIGDCRRDEFRLLVSRRRGPAPGRPRVRCSPADRPAPPAGCFIDLE